MRIGKNCIPYSLHRKRPLTFLAQRWKRRKSRRWSNVSDRYELLWVGGWALLKYKQTMFSLTFTIWTYNNFSGSRQHDQSQTTFRGQIRNYGKHLGPAPLSHSNHLQMSCSIKTFINEKLLIFPHSGLVNFHKKTWAARLFKENGCRWPDINSYRKMFIFSGGFQHSTYQSE